MGQYFEIALAAPYKLERKPEPSCVRGDDVKRNTLLMGLVLLVGLTGCGAEKGNFGTPDVIDDSLTGHIYLLPEDTILLPDFTQLSPVGTVYTTRLDIASRDFNEGFPAVVDRLEWFGLQYKGTLRVETAGTYTFGVNSDDGSKLYIGSELIVNNDFQHNPILKRGDIYLEAGEYPLTLEYFQGPRYEIALQLFITPPGRVTQIFDSTEVY